jgi:hypothetical protein
MCTENIMSCLLTPSNCPEFRDYVLLLQTYLPYCTQSQNYIGLAGEE